MSADAARMLGDCLAALRAQRPFIRGRADYEDACKRGVSSTQRYYGDPLVDATREAIRRMAWREAARGVATLLVCYPRGLAHLLKRGTPDQ